MLLWGLMHSMAWAREPVASWHFDAELNVPGDEDANASIETIQGKWIQVPGVVGRALRLDGYSTRLVRDAKHAPRLPDGFTVTAWVALGAYPWNWAPILAQEKTQCIPAPPEDICWPATVDPNQEQAGYYLVLGPRSVGSALGVEWQVAGVRLR